MSHRRVRKRCLPVMPSRGQATAQYEALDSVDVGAPENLFVICVVIERVSTTAVV